MKPAMAASGSPLTAISVKRRATAHVQSQFRPRIGNTRRKTSLVDPPQRVKVGGLEIANREGHAAIVAGSSFPKRLASAAKKALVPGFPQFSELEMIAPCFLRNLGRTMSI